jgi:hypothetical protein
LRDELAKQPPATAGQRSDNQRTGKATE